ncbi:MAG: dihydropteroate synthase [Panacagrimonas sp.]
MGVLNLTPDSFSDGGCWASVEVAVTRARQMVEEGAEFIDVGGESTRPGAQAVTEQEELDRVIPVIERLRLEADCVISIDTMKPAVMKAACAAGAQLINDVNALRAPGAVAVTVSTGAAICLMHMQGEPRTMQHAPNYADVVSEVRSLLLDRAAQCEAAGIARDAILIDPGFGFGKRLEHNLALLARLETLVDAGYPVLVGLSRKSMFGQIAGAPVDQRLAAGLSAAAIAVLKGAAIVRTHDVSQTRDAVAVAAAVRNRQEAER